MVVKPCVVNTKSLNAETWNMHKHSYAQTFQWNWPLECTDQRQHECSLISQALLEWDLSWFAHTTLKLNCTACIRTIISSPEGNYFFYEYYFNQEKYVKFCEVHQIVQVKHISLNFFCFSTILLLVVGKNNFQNFCFFTFSLQKLPVTHLNSNFSRSHGWQHNHACPKTSKESIREKNAILWKRDRIFSPLFLVIRMYYVSAQSSQVSTPVNTIAHTFLSQSKLKEAYFSHS